MRLSFAAIASSALMAAAPAQAGLINPTSTVDVSFSWVNVTPFTQWSQVFNTAAPGPFSLAAPIYPPSPPLHTTEPFNLGADTGFWFTNTTVTIYNNSNPPVPFCFSSSNTGSACEDPYNTFDFVFTNEDITSVSIDPGSSADFQLATFGSHTGLTLVSPNEFTVDVTGANPAYLSTLVIDVTTGNANGGGGAIPEPSTWAMIILGFAGLSFAGWRRAGVIA